MKKLFTLLISAAALMLAGAEKKIVFVGDSISCGVGASPREMRFSTVAVKLLAENSGKYIEHNIAISGSTMSNQAWPGRTTSGYPYRLKDVIAAKPDIVVVQHGVNDNGTRCSLAEYFWSYRQFIREVKAALPNAGIVCMTITPVWRSPENMHYMATVNTGIQEIAAKENCIVVHIEQALNGERKYFPDALHPNNDGHKIMAETLAAAIRENRVQKEDDFDFVIRKAGSYNICNWTFEVSAEAAKGGFTVFRNIGKNGFTYSSHGPVKVISPMNYYGTEVLCKTSDLPAAPEFFWHHYTKCGTWKLLSTGGKEVKITVAEPPPLTGSKTADLSSLNAMQKDWLVLRGNAANPVSCSDGVFSGTVKAPGSELRLLSRQKFQNVRLEAEIKLDDLNAGCRAYFGLITTVPWHHDSAWVMLTGSKDGGRGTFYVHTKGKSNKNSSLVRSSFTSGKWHNIVIENSKNGASLTVDGVLKGKVTDPEILPAVAMPAIFTISSSKAPFTIQLRNLKVTTL